MKPEFPGLSVKADLGWKTLYAAKIAQAPPPSKKKPLTEPLSQAEWDSMEGKARWDSIVALRGPDLVNSDSLKWFTTSVIRYRLSKVMRVGGLVNHQLGFLVLPEHPSSYQPVGSFDIGHFLNHAREAACWLKIPIVSCSISTFEEIIAGSYDSRHKALIALFEQVSDGPIRKHIGNLIGKSVGDSSEEDLPCE